MYRESYTRLYGAEDVHLKPGECFALPFDGAGMGQADRLFFTGETALFYQWKNEPDYPITYRYIDDSLNAKEAYRCQYCLDYSGEAVPYPKCAFHKVIFPPVLSYLALVGAGDRWTMGIRVKAENLRVREGGYLRFVFEVRAKKEGVDKRGTLAEPDEVLTLSVPEGTYGWRELAREFTLRAESTANVCCFLEGENYEGRVFFENPLFLSDNGHNLLPDFAPWAGEKAQFNWIGQNLSRKEWPEFDIALNGEPLYRGALFERCHRYSENEIPLPAGAVREGKNELSIRLISDYREALAYDLHEIGLISHEKGLLVACPEIVRAGEPFALLLDVPEDRAEITWRVGKETGRAVFAQKGLHGLKVPGPEPGRDIPVSVACGGREDTGVIARCVVHDKADGVITGTSAIIYICQRELSFRDYLCWYFSNQVGNLLTFRHTYRWSGARFCDRALFKKTAALLNELDVRYAHIMDGRELPGYDMNPPMEALAGPGFLGRQAHERDGALVYWGLRDITGNLNQEMYYDMLLRIRRRNPEGVGQDGRAKHYFRGGRHTVYRDPAVPADMEAAANAFVQSLRDTRGDAARHDGPATLFKYFYQAGYAWAGAETMYGPTEIVCSALRGAAALYGGPTGAHLAVQWSSSPHDTPARYRRYLLGLYVSYLQGIDEINTEEGLWHLEEYYSYFHRFSDACLNHTRVQRDFYRWVLSHSRTGTFETPFAFLSGRFDGWRCFGRSSTWGREDFGFSEAEKAWDILRCFWPRSELKSLYVHGCPDEPQGFYTGTPHGNADIIPVEHESIPPYKLLVAPGYGKALPEDMEKLEAYVRRGGKLVLGWPQLSVTTNRADVTEYRHWYIDHSFRTAIAGEACFAQDTYQGQPLSVSAAPSPHKAILLTDSGRALVWSVKLGEGEVFFVNAREYAGRDAVAAAYRELLSRLVPECAASQPVWARGSEDVQFSVFDQGNGQKHVYFLAADWFHAADAPRAASLVLNGVSCPVEVPFGSPVKAVCRGDTAVWPADARNEVLSNDGKTARVQGTGLAEFMIARGGKVTRKTVDFTDECVKEIEAGERGHCSRGEQ